MSTPGRYKKQIYKKSFGKKFSHYLEITHNNGRVDTFKILWSVNGP